MILFATGAGNTIGSMVAPTVKITGNVNTARHLADDIDVDISACCRPMATCERWAMRCSTASLASRRAP